jgi:hypothetical protein
MQPQTRHKKVEDMAMEEFPPALYPKKSLLLVSLMYSKRSLGFSHDHYSSNPTTLVGSVAYSKLELQRRRE